MRSFQSKMKKATLLICVFYFSCTVLADTSCRDNKQKSACDSYKRRGFCKNNAWVRANCKATCSICKPTTTCYDLYNTATCERYKRYGYCKRMSWMRINCRKTCSFCGTTNPTTVAPSTTRTTQGTTPKTNSPTTKVYPTSPPGSCGISTVKNPKVIAGVKSKAGQWPWQIAMFKSGRFSCGGSLISPQWVVTAAHCISKLRSPVSLEIVLGDLHRSQKSGTEQTISVSRIVKHSAYGSLNYDIALLKLSNPAKLTDQIRTVCLPKHGEHVKVGTTCYISGWGKTRHPGGSVNELQHAGLKIISKSNCTKRNGKYGRITDVMVCATNGGDAKQSGCHGDSGGPFVCQRNDGSWVLHGVVSWGSPRCNAAEASTVFARVSALRNWIDDQMKKY